MIQMLVAWRLLHAGATTVDEDGKTVVIKYSLRDAADEINASKKTLDDYQL